MNAFIDASVLFSASYSATGASREILLRAVRGEVSLCISDLVLEETRRNLTVKAPRALAALDVIIALIPFTVTSASKGVVLDACRYTELKDAPIVAAAIESGCQFLVSLDRVHLVDAPEVAKESGLRVLVPMDLLKILRAAIDEQSVEQRKANS